MKAYLFNKKIFKSIISLTIAMIFLTTNSLCYASNFSRNIKRGEKLDPKTSDISVIYTFDTPELTPQENGYFEITMTNTETENETGKPRIPVSYVKILLPFATDLDSCTITPGEKIKLKGMYEIAYGDKPIPMLSKEELIASGFDLSPAEPDQTIYLSSNKYPSEIFTNPTKQSDKGYVFSTLNLHPVEYIPSTGEISYYKSITVELKTKSNSIDYSYRANEKDKELILNKYLSRITRKANAINKKEGKNDVVDKNTALQKLNENQKEIKQNILNSYPTDFESISSSMSNGNVYPDGRSLSKAGMNPPGGNAPLNPLTGDCQYLIITNDDLKDSFQVLANHKSTRAINPISACVVTVEEIYANPDYSCTGPYNWGDTCGSNNQFNDDPAKIRNYIRYAYQNLGTEYVLLGGDADKTTTTNGDLQPPIVPIRYLGSYLQEVKHWVQGQFVFWYNRITTIPSDLYFSNLYNSFDSNNDGYFMAGGDGNFDLISDVFVGRAPVDSAVEADNFVQKTILAQTNNNRMAPMMAGEYLGHYGSVYKYSTGEMEEIKFGAPSYLTLGFVPTYSDEEISTLYDAPPGGSPSSPPEYQWNATDLMSHMNSGVTLFNHLGHANNTTVMKLNLNNVSALNNPTPMFIYSQGCYPGALDNWVPGNSIYNQGYLTPDDSIAERFLTFSPTKGAFATVMNSRYGWLSTTTTNGPSQLFARWFWDGAFNNVSGPEKKSLGRINSYSHEKNNWNINNFYAQWVYTETNLLGDPEYHFNFEENAALTADAGGPQTANEYSLVTLNGSGSQGENLSYSWSANNPNIEIINSSQAIAEFTVPEVSENTEIILTLEVTDGIESDTDQAVITIYNFNTPPNANAGNDSQVTFPYDSEEVGILDGQASSDPDNNTLEYQWTQTSGASVQIVYSNSALAYFEVDNPSEDTDLTFKLTVSDGYVEDTDEVVVTIIANNPPVAINNPWLLQFSEEEEVSINLNDNFQDPDTVILPLSFFWQQAASDPLQVVSAGYHESSTISFSAPNVDGDTDVHFTCIAKDGPNTVANNQITITIQDNPTANQAPTADAGVNQIVDEEILVTLDGSASSDPENDNLTYLWTAPEGITLSSTTAAKPTFTAPDVVLSENYVFNLIVNDGELNSQADYVTITVNNVIVNQAPTADAGVNQIVDEEILVTLDGSASSDPENDNLTYLWTAPEGITLSSTTAAKPTFTAPDVVLSENYVFNLVVKDGELNSQTDYVTITVNNVIVNTAPAFNPLNYASTILDTASVGAEIITVTALDDNIPGPIEYSLYTGGQGYFSIDSSSGLVKTIQPLQEGVYNLKIDAYDGELNAEQKANVVITVEHEQNYPNQQVVYLKSGWNFFAPAVEASSMKVEDLLVQLGDNLVFAHDSKGKSYWPSQNINNITQTLSPKYGVKIKVSAPTTLIIQGDPIQGNGDITLNTGTHYIGFLNNKSAIETVQELIDNDALTIVYDSSNNSYIGKENGQWTNTIGEFKRGNTYMITLSKGGTLNIK